MSFALEFDGEVASWRKKMHKATNQFLNKPHFDPPMSREPDRKMKAPEAANLRTTTTTTMSR